MCVELFMEVKMKKHITLNQRYLLNTLIREKHPAILIAKALDKNLSTIYREIKNNRIIVNDDANESCKYFNKFPFVCGKDCKHGSKRVKKAYYNYKIAHNNYRNNLILSRKGIDLSIDQLDYLNDLFYDKLVMKNQSIYHIIKTNNLNLSQQTIYRYISSGILPSISDEHLIRKPALKPRKKACDNVDFIPSSIRKNRQLKDFKEFIKKHPDINVVEMDTVIGKKEDDYCFLTLLFRKQKLMLVFYIRHYKPDSVTEVFNYLRNKLGVSNFKSLFKVILTDNGFEFSKPFDIEYNYLTKEKEISVFYTDPYSSWQKGKLERNHEFIRYVIPKGISFDNLNLNSVINIQNNINNTIRKSLNDLSPYQLFLNEYGEEICESFNLSYIPSDDVDLSYKILK